MLCCKGSPNGLGVGDCCADQHGSTNLTSRVGQDFETCWYTFFICCAVLLTNTDSGTLVVPPSASVGTEMGMYSTSVTSLQAAATEGTSNLVLLLTNNAPVLYMNVRVATG